MDYKYTVCTECFTYNQELFIKDTLEGFAMQQTTFPVVSVIVDDASTDNTADVIWQYMVENFDLQHPESFQKEMDYGKVVYARNKNNSNSYFAVIYLKENHYQKGKHELKNDYIKEWVDNSKYIAFCEGDDYWITQDKLQKQVLLLEDNPNIGMCYSKCRYYYNNKRKFASKAWGGPSTEIIDLLKRNTIPTLTVLCKTELFLHYSEEDKPNNWLMGDLPLWLYCAAVSKIAFMDEEFGVYRVLNNSASHTKSIDKKMSFSMNQVDIMEYYDKKYNIGYGHDYYERMRERLVLRTYAIYYKLGMFVKEIIKIKKKRNKIGRECYKYAIFFVFPWLAKTKQ